MLPQVSLILPIRNEELYLRRSLDAVLRQDYPQEKVETIIADGMSTDGSREIIREYQAAHPSISLIDNPGKIAPIGLNQALALARGEIIIRVDGHCEIAPDYVRHCVQHILEEAVDGVGGAMETVGETWVAQAIALAMSSRFGVGDSAFRILTGKTRLVDTLPFPAYTRKIIRRAGLYDEELVRNQDDEYNYRLRDLGAKILLAADVRSRYYSRSGLSSLWRQYYQYGFWKVRVLQKHPLQMRPRQFIPPVFIASLLISAVAALFTSRGDYGLAAILAAYWLGNLAASGWVAAHRGWRYLPLLPVIYAILHCAYGTGFLWGIVRFSARWGDKEGKTPRLSNGL
jgi:glycosyltransferase involved in cell wall biosynthesis